MESGGTMTLILAKARRPVREGATEGERSQPWPLSNACWELPTAKNTMRFFQKESSSSLMTLLDANPPTLGLISQGKPCGQKASFFCLENEHWRIIGLDTAYDSIGWPLLEYFARPACALRPEQIDWFREIVRPRDDDPRGIILLSHHQYYSRYDNWYPQQAKQLAEFFSRPVLWFWGHEHRLAIYEEFGVRGGVRAFGRCIGHGGMPVELPPAKPKHAQCVIEFTDRRHYPNDENLTIGFNGFAKLSLHDNRTKIQYVDVHGATIFSESWTCEDGKLQRDQKC